MAEWLLKKNNCLFQPPGYIFHGRTDGGREFISRVPDSAPHQFPFTRRNSQYTAELCITRHPGCDRNELEPRLQSSRFQPHDNSFKDVGDRGSWILPIKKQGDSCLCFICVSRAARPSNQAQHAPVSCRSQNYSAPRCNPEEPD